MCPRLLKQGVSLQQNVAGSLVKIMTALGTMEVIVSHGIPSVVLRSCAKSAADPPLLSRPTALQFTGANRDR